MSREESERLGREREDRERQNEQEQAKRDEVVKVGDASTSAKAYDPSSDAASSLLLDVEGIVRTEGIAIYRDQAGRLWTGLATYWIKKGEFDLATATFEEGIRTVLTLRDFTQIFDAYAEFSESYISGLMDGLAEADEEDVESDEKEMDECMKRFEELMDRRPFLVNEVLLRRNPNDVQEWEKRVALHGTDDTKVRSFPPLLARELTSSCRSPRPTPRRLRRSSLAKRPPTSTRSGSISQSSTSRAALLEKPRRTSRARARSLRRPSRCRLRRSTSWQKCGASGRRWRFGMSGWFEGVGE